MLVVIIRREKELVQKSISVLREITGAIQLILPI